MQDHGSEIKQSLRNQKAVKGKREIWLTSKQFELADGNWGINEYFKVQAVRKTAGQLSITLVSMSCRRFNEQHSTSLANNAKGRMAMRF